MQNSVQDHDSSILDPDHRAPQAFLAGSRAIGPLPVGVAPFVLAYTLSARSAVLDLFQTQLMSTVVFAGGAHFNAVGLITGGRLL